MRLFRGLRRRHHVRMVMRDIPRDEWNVFLEEFSRQHRDEPVTVAKSDMREGLRFAERATPLMGISHDGERISITGGEHLIVRVDRQGAHR